MSISVGAIKVKIGLTKERRANYPKFNLLQVVKDSGIDWCFYVDSFGLGWQYDKTSGHKEDTEDSPIGQQWGVLLAPIEFVNQAVAMFPNEVIKLNEGALADFYDNKVKINDPDEILDSDILIAIKTKQDLNLELTTQQQNALNPLSDERGVCKNKEKIWVDYKVLKNIQFEE